MNFYYIVSLSQVYMSFFIKIIISFRICYFMYYIYIANSASLFKISKFLNIRSKNIPNLEIIYECVMYVPSIFRFPSTCYLL